MFQSVRFWRKLEQSPQHLTAVTTDLCPRYSNEHQSKTYYAQPPAGWVQIALRLPKSQYNPNDLMSPSQYPTDQLSPQYSLPKLCLPPEPTTKNTHCLILSTMHRYALSRGISLPKGYCPYEPTTKKYRFQVFINNA